MEEHPFNPPKYFFDELKLQLVFPEEIWLLIFDNIQDSNDYHRIDAASPYFHTLLLPLRTRILFPEVIKLCSKSMVLTDETYYSLLHCQSACKAWKLAVDATFHQILSETNTDSTDWKRYGFSKEIMNRNQERILFPLNIYDNIYKKHNKWDKCLEFFHDSHFLTGSNPFPTRSINIPAPFRNICNKLRHILKIYGHHIWHCYVILLCVSREEMPQRVLVVREFLGLLPNLQTLRIQNFDNVYSRHIPHSENFLPNLDKLQLLSEDYPVGRSIFSHLIQNNSHIKKLWISELDSDHIPLFSTTPLPNLEELHILGFRSPVFTAENFLQLLNVQVQSQLKNLTFKCHSDVPHVNHVFSWIEARWSQTLTELSIIIPSSVPVSDIESTIKLPNLKNLRIKMERYACLDFIADLSKALVNLSVYHDGQDEFDDSLEANSKIQFFSQRENLGKSNIWKFFPRLREIKYAERSEGELSAGHTYRRNHWVGFSLE